MYRLLKRLLLLAALSGAVAFWFKTEINRPYIGSAPPIDLEFTPGTRSQTIAAKLQAAGVLRDRYPFLALHYLMHKQTLKAGEYSFDRPLSPREVMGILVRGEVARKEVTIPEGMNRFDIAAVIAGTGLATREEFLKASQDTSLIEDLVPMAPSLEGYLFPDTYYFPRRGGATPIVRAMVNRFRQVYTAITIEGADRPTREVVAIASMIETETGNPKERPMVASVFYNRLKRGIPLQCDPTVIYAAILNHTFDGTIGRTDLNSRSPYNTYTHTGLPPGPIANPGKASLLAALHPSTTNYLYFVANPEGHHTFSRTLTEHNLAVTLYRRGLER